MLEMSLEIAKVDDAYEDMATKYYGPFVFIAEALNKIDREHEGTWDSEEGFFYDRLVLPDGRSARIKICSIAGMLSLAAVVTIKKETLEQFPKFKASVLWFKQYRMENLKFPIIQESEDGEDLLLSLVPNHRLQLLIKGLLDEKEFLSPHGIRSLSKIHETPYQIQIDGIDYSIDYEPAESSVSLFGGNSNWRSPVWMPMHYLFIQSLREYHSFCGKDMQFEYPTGSGIKMDLHQISNEISKRLIKIFEKDTDEKRPFNLLHDKHYTDTHFKDLVLFYEYFHGENGGD
ncbi:MAG: hypothetical protein ACJAU2_001727 [Maribacter sp.]|jgi:hypothetical protein